jgi:hypothetical protein
LDDATLQRTVLPDRTASTQRIDQGSFAPCGRAVRAEDIADAPNAGGIEGVCNRVRQIDRTRRRRQPGKTEDAREVLAGVRNRHVACLADDLSPKSI